MTSKTTLTDPCRYRAKRCFCISSSSSSTTLPKFTAEVCKRRLQFREVDKGKHRSTDGQLFCRDAFKNRSLSKSYQHNLHQVATSGQTDLFSAQREDLDIPTHVGKCVGGKSDRWMSSSAIADESVQSAHHGTHQDMPQIKETKPFLLSSCQLLLTVLTHLEISTLINIQSGAQ